MSEIKIATRLCSDDLGNEKTFHYFLTVDQIQSDHFFCEDYGVRIADERGDSTAVSSVTTSAMRIDELMSMLVEHQVGPVGLEDVIADWL